MCWHVIKYMVSLRQKPKLLKTVPENMDAKKAENHLFLSVSL